MRHLFHLRWLLLFALVFGGRSLAHASHLIGGDIAYRPIASTSTGIPRYHVTVRLFVNVGVGNFDQTSIALLATQGSCSSPTASGFWLIPRSSQTPGTWMGCNGGSAIYAVNLYEVDVNLDPGQWTLACLGENRVGDVQNMLNATPRSFYVSTTLDNSLTTQNASPVFLSTTLPLLTGAGQSTFSFSAFDADGDSLAYAYTPPQEVTGGVQAAQVPGTCPVPIASAGSPHFALNAFTGALTRLAGSSMAQAGRFVVAVSVAEYRRLNGQWRLLGAATRDILYLVTAGSNQPPAFTSASVDGGPAQAPDPLVVVRRGQTVQVVLTAADPDAGQLLSFSSRAPGAVPGLSFTPLSATQAQLRWQIPADQPPGRYAIPVTVTDNGCPYSASEDRTVQFLVSSNRALGSQPGATVALALAYPTPFHEQVQFAAPAGQAVQVTDALGREVARLLPGPDGLVRWHPDALPAGLYLAHLASTGQPLARLLRAD